MAHYRSITAEHTHDLSHDPDLPQATENAQYEELVVSRRDRTEASKDSIY